MNKQEKLNKLARGIAELQFLQLTEDQIERYVKQALYDDLAKHGNADEELTSQAIASFFDGDEEEEVQYYLDNGYTKEETAEFMSVEKPKHPAYEEDQPKRKYVCWLG
jgi:hypothetical protein